MLEAEDGQQVQVCDEAPPPPPRRLRDQELRRPGGVPGGARTLPFEHRRDGAEVEGEDRDVAHLLCDQQQLGGFPVARGAVEGRSADVEGVVGEGLGLRARQQEWNVQLAAQQNDEGLDEAEMEARRRSPRSTRRAAGRRTASGNATRACGRGRRRCWS